MRDPNTPRTRDSAFDNLWACRRYEAPSVTCDACGSPPGRPCYGNGWMRAAHRRRVLAGIAHDAEQRGFLMGAAAAAS